MIFCLYIYLFILPFFDLNTTFVSGGWTKMISTSTLSGVLNYCSVLLCVWRFSVYVNSRRSCQHTRPLVFCLNFKPEKRQKADGKIYVCKISTNISYKLTPIENSMNFKFYAKVSPKTAKKKKQTANFTPAKFQQTFRTSLILLRIRLQNFNKHFIKA